MTTVVTIKLTEAEIQLLDDLVHATQCESRSQLIRLALRNEASDHPRCASQIPIVKLQRRNHTARRSARIARMVGFRDRGEATAATPI